MNGVIDVHDLPREKVELVEKLVGYLRERIEEEKKEEETADIKFASWPLGATGTLSRREIYDYL